MARRAVQEESFVSEFEYLKKRKTNEKKKKPNEILHLFADIDKWTNVTTIFFKSIKKERKLYQRGMGSSSIYNIFALNVCTKTKQ